LLYLKQRGERGGVLRSGRYLRWLTLLVSLVVECAAFWIGGPPADPQAGLGAAIALKAADPQSWIWVGWAAFTLAWLFPEIVYFLYADGRRSRRLLDKAGNDELVYDTGLHWLVLLRDIHTGRSIDGDEDELREPLFAKGAPSFTWFAVWIPIAMATVTMLFFLGWIASLTATFPGKLLAWSAAARSFVEPHLSGLGFVARSVDFLLTELPQWLAALYVLARGNTVAAFAWLAGIWIAARFLGNLLKRVPLASPTFRLIRRLTFIATLFVLMSLFDWLSPAYSVLPDNGLAAVGFIPLTFASIFYVWHVASWSSWRYAIIRDTKSHDATLIMLGGVFNFLKREFQTERIVDTRLHQQWWERMLGVGNLEIIQVGGGAGENDEIKYIAGPNRLDRALKECIRTRRRRAAGITE
jgi:hypothetical protein